MPAAGAPAAPEQLIQTEALKAVSPSHEKNAVAKQKIAEKRTKEGNRAAIEDMRERRSFGPTNSELAKAAEKNRVEDPAVPGASKTEQDKKLADQQAETRLLSAYVRGGLAELKKVNVTEANRFSTLMDSGLKGTPWLAEAYKTNPQLKQELLNSATFRREVNRIMHQKMGQNVEQMAVSKIPQVDVDAHIATAKGMTPPKDLTPEQARAELWKAKLKPEQTAMLLAAQDEWAASFNNVIGEATESYLNNEFDAADNIIAQEADEIDAETEKMAAEKGLGKADAKLKALEADWSQTDKGMASDRVEASFENLASGGIEAVLKAEGVDQKTIDMIMKDDALRTKYESQIVNSLVRKRLRSGRITEQDFYRLIDAPWCGQDKMIEFFTQHKASKKLLENMKDENVRRSFMDNLKRLPKNKLFIALMLLLVGTTGGALALGAPLIAGGAGLAAAGAGGAYGTSGH